MNRETHRTVSTILGILPLLAAFGGASFGQARVSIETGALGPVPIVPRSNIRVSTTLVLIPVTVTDPLDRIVTGLEKENFLVFEDRREQKITQFSMEEAPIAVGLVFDTSGSMGNKLRKSRQAVAEFFRTANPDDQFFLVQFNDRAELLHNFTHRPEEIQSRVAFIQPNGKTALLDAVYLAIHNMHKAKPNYRKALLILSDGADNSSRYSEREIKNLVRESDVQIYAIGIFEPISSRGRTAEELSGPSLLTEISEESGGRHFPVENLNDLPDIAAKIGTDLRTQYILGYAPSNQARDGKYRRIQLKLVPPRGLPPLRAFWRLGYYAPID